MVAWSPAAVPGSIPGGLSMFFQTQLSVTHAKDVRIVFASLSLLLCLSFLLVQLASIALAYSLLLLLNSHAS